MAITLQDNTGPQDTPLPSVNRLDSLISTTYKESSIIQALIPSYSTFKNLIQTIIDNHIDVNQLVIDRNDLSFEIIVENERGLKICGIQLFSSMFLIPSIDSVSQFMDSKGIEINDDLKLFTTVRVDCGDDIEDIGVKWKWSWSQWFVLCFNGDINIIDADQNDVDENAAEQTEEQTEELKEHNEHKVKRNLFSSMFFNPNRAIYCDYEGWFYSKNFTMTNWYGDFSFWRSLFCRRRLLIRLKEKIK